MGYDFNRLTDEQRKQSRKSRSTNAKKINFRKIVKRRRQEGEIPDRRTAIRNHCLECMGYASHEVKVCTAAKCWMYPWRLGALEEEQQ